MTRALAFAFVLAGLAGLGACTEPPLGDTSLAVVGDVDGSGTLDCHDLQLVLYCTHHPHAHECAHADVTGDGHINDADVHHVAHAILATGHHCAEPGHDHGGHHNTDHVDYPHGDEHDDGHEDTHHEDTVIDHDGHHPDDPHDPHG